MTAPAGEDLYALPPQEFVAARDVAVRAARAAGDRHGAARLAGLRRPTAAAYLVNRLARERPEVVAAALDVGDRLRVAQSELRGGDVRALSAERQAALAAAADAVRALDPAVRDDTLTEVIDTLAAALAEPEVAADVRAGRVTKAVRYSGLGGFELVAVPPAAAPPRTSPTKPGRRGRAAPEPAGEPAKGRPAGRKAATGPAERASTAERDEAAATLAAADGALADAQRAVGQLDEDLTAARARVRDLERRRIAAERDLRRAAAARQRAARRTQK